MAVGLRRGVVVQPIEPWRVGRFHLQCVDTSKGPMYLVHAPGGARFFMAYTKVLQNGLKGTLNQVLQKRYALEVEEVDDE